jgi:hypothetical protein
VTDGAALVVEPGLVVVGGQRRLRLLAPPEQRSADKRFVSGAPKAGQGARP